MFETFRKRCSMLPFFNWFHLSIFARSLQVWCSRDFWWPCTDSQHGFHQQSGVQGASIALLALRPLWTFWADLVLKIRQGLFGGAICGRDASSHRLDYYKELPTWLFYARRKTSKKNSSLNFKPKSVWDKKHTTKNIFGLHSYKFREVFSFFKVWLMDLKSLENSGHPWIFSCGWSWRTLSVVFFSNVDPFYLNPSTGWRVDVAGYPTEPLQDPVDLPGFWRAPRNWEVP